MTDFAPYLVLISPTGIRVREAYGWQPLADDEALPLPDGYQVVHSQDADTRWWQNVWGVGLAVMAVVLGCLLLAGAWNLGAGH